MNKIKFRCGNGSPLLRVTGIDSAAAKETTPLIPVRPKSIGMRKRILFDLALGATPGLKIKVAMSAE